MAQKASITVAMLGEDTSLGRTLDKGSKDVSRFGDDVDKHTGRAGASFKGLAVAAAGAFAAMGIGQFLKGALAEAEDSARIAAVTDQLVQQTGASAWTSSKQIDQLAMSISNKTGLDDEDIASMENVLLTYSKVTNQVGAGNDVFDRTIGVATDLSAVFGTDLTSASNMMGKALQDPTAGLSKLTKVGVTFTDSEKEKIKALQASGDVLGAQKLMLAAVEGQVGGAAEANATATQKMTTVWGNFKEYVGGFILPAFTSIVDMAITIMPAAMATMDEAVKTAGDKWKDFTGWLSDNEDTLRKLQPVVVAFAGVVGGLLIAYQASSAMSSLAIGIKAVGIAMAANPVGLIITALAAVAAGVYYAYTHFEGFRNVVDNVGRTIRDVFVNDVLPKLQAAWTVISEDVLPVVVAGLTRLWEILKTVGEVIVVNTIGAWQLLSSIVGSFVGWLKEHVAPVFVAFGELLAAVWARISDAVSMAWGIISPIISAGMTIISSVLSVLWTVLEPLWSAYWAVMGAVMAGVWETIKSVASAAWEFLKSTVEAGLRFVQGIIQFFTGIISGDWGKAWDGIKNVFGSIWDGIANVVRFAMGVIGGIVSGGWEAIRSFFSGAGQGIKDAASGLFDGVKDAFRAAINWIVDKWNGLSFSLPEAEIFGQKVGGWSLNTPDIPRLADGGLVRARPGGTLALIGEGGRDEAVIPLDKSGVLPTGPASGGTTSNVTNINVHAETNADAFDIAREAAWQLRTAGVA